MRVEGMKTLIQNTVGVVPNLRVLLTENFIPYLTII